MASKKSAVKKSAPAKGKAVAAPTAVAVKGGLVVTNVLLTGQVYRTKAPHNLGWFTTISNAAKGGKPVAVAPLCATQANPGGIPAAFFGYCIRRGYLKQA